MIEVQKYHGWVISDVCPPIGTRAYDYYFAPECDDEPDDDGHYAHQDLHGWSDSVEGCKKQIDEMRASLENCPACSGVGYINWSCCGDDITGNDYDNCPTCLEHCSTDIQDADTCEDCRGTGRQIDNL